MGRYIFTAPFFLLKNTAFVKLKKAKEEETRLVWNIQK